MKPFDLEYVKKHWAEAQAGTLLVTRDGSQARLYALDGVFKPIHGAVCDNGGWVQYSWRLDGSYSGGKMPNGDLFILPRKVKKWAVVCGTKTSAEAIREMCFTRDIPIQEIEVEE